MKIKPIPPLISCICITKNRPEMLLRSINLFDKQIYPNTELIISYTKTDIVTKNLIADFSNNTDLKIIGIERLDNESIGVARNNAIANCNGDFICMWDDDDIYSRTRIAEQYNSICEKDSSLHISILTQILLYNYNLRKVYLSFPSYWTCSLLCSKDYMLKYPCADRDEFEYIPIIEFLNSTKILSPVGLDPALYTYVYHGSNRMKYTTFLQLMNQSELLDDTISKNVKEYLALK